MLNDGLITQGLWPRIISAWEDFRREDFRRRVNLSSRLFEPAQEEISTRSDRLIQFAEKLNLALEYMRLSRVAVYFQRPLCRYFDFWSDLMGQG